jgi:hypothetical protein
MHAGGRLWSFLLVSLVAIVGCAGIKLPNALAYSPQGDRVAWLPGERVLEVLDLPSNHAVWRATLADPPSFAAGFARYSPGGRFLVVWQRSWPDLKSDHFSVWDASSGQQISPFLAGTASCASWGRNSPLDRGVVGSSE